MKRIAIASLVLGFAAIVLGFISGIGIVLAIVAMLFGFIAVHSPRARGIAGKMAMGGMTLGVVGLIVSIMPKFNGGDARKTASESDVRANIPRALKAFRLDNGSYPTTEEGLWALWEKPPSATNWNGPYLKKMPIDPWRNEYVYRCPGKDGRDYDLICYGADGQEGGRGYNADIESSRWHPYWKIDEKAND